MFSSSPGNRGAGPARVRNPINSADNAFGLTLGLESVGIYSPGSVRGFSPITAGNVRIDGMYLGGRYKFTAFGENSTLRLQIQNALGSKEWEELYTPGFFLAPGTRTVFAYLTTDLQ